MARITRRELKTDKFAVEVGHGLTFFEEHQKELVRYGTIAVILIAVFFAVRSYRGHQHTLREDALARAIQIQETAVGPPTQGASQSFPTQRVKDEAATKAFTDITTKYPGSDEAEIATYYLGSISADQANLAAAEKSFQEVAQKGNERYASLAKLSLGQVYFAEGKLDLAEKTLRDLAAHPTLFVSADQANIALARLLMASKPAEARKILDPIRNRQGAVGQVALTLYGQISQ
ncbi:MAG: tetratricopeptide repeat protein [Acidobacteriia bacterium]|nr:tetratricopeptide repeat protein [Terriglobia bacterium]